MPERRRTLYGASIGVLMLETHFRRFHGDIGNARTWPFPVQYKVVQGASADRITSLTDQSFLEPFKQAADELVALGVDGIVTTCGFLALYQRELTNQCPVPVATSALLQVPMVARLLPRGRRPAIITFSREGLTPAHLTGVGVAPDTPIYGMPPASRFQRSIRTGDTGVDYATLAAEVEAVVEAAIADDPAIGALVLECTNMSPYSAALRRRFALPVFDIVSLVHWFHRGLEPQQFDRE